MRTRSRGGGGGRSTIVGLRIFSMLFEEGRREGVRESYGEGKTCKAERKLLERRTFV